FFSQLPPELFFKYKFSYDYRLKTKGASYKRILQQVIPLYYFPEGGARTLGIFTDLSNLNIQGIPKLSFIGMQGAPSYYNIHLKKDFHLSQNPFTKKELEILTYIIDGAKSEEIAKNLNRSIHTVRNHRKNILHKAGCANVQGIPKLSFIGMQGAPSYYNIHLKKDFHLSQNPFTKKELEILTYIIDGAKSEEIAKNLNRSIHTVRNHRKNILHKAGCANVQGLLMKSIREGWI